MGIGKKSTPAPFVNACEVFVYTENLLSEAEVTKRAKRQTGSKDAADTPDPKPLLKKAFDLAVQDDGWAFLGVMGQHLRQLTQVLTPAPMVTNNFLSSSELRANCLNSRNPVNQMEHPLFLFEKNK